LLHQGTEQVNSDFIICKERHAGKTMAEKEAYEEQQELNIANCLAQSRVLALGSDAMTEEERNGSNAFQQYHGNQPSTTIVMDRLSPYNLGGLIALYEHKVFVSSVLWDINPFDQWGVELGKKMARQLQPVLNGQEEPTLDSSTSALVSVIRAK
jgi:glucose-6-phosphate isomerase